MLALVSALVACVSSAPAGAAPTAPTAECLAWADAKDGTTDHVVHRCPNCGLGMDGSPEHASVVGEHTLHSCSPTCKAAFDADPGAVLARSCPKK